jgi:hypothetical protein
LLSSKEREEYISRHAWFTISFPYPYFISQLAKQTKSLRITSTTPTNTMNDIPAPIPSSYTIRPATELDVAGINVIINHEIAESVNNFNYSPRSFEEGLVWFKGTINGGYPIFVATTVNDAGNEVVAGYSSLGSFRSKDGYRL